MFADVLHSRLAVPRVRLRKIISPLPKYVEQVQKQSGPNDVMQKKGGGGSPDTRTSMFVYTARVLNFQGHSDPLNNQRDSTLGLSDRS